MTLPAVLAAAASLALQVTLLIAVSAWLARQADNERVGDRIWQVCHSLILIITLAAFAIPHLRLLPPSVIFGDENLAGIAALESRVGLVFVGVWLTGFVVGVAGLVLGILNTGRLLRTAVPIPVTLLQQRCRRVPGHLPDGRDIVWLRSGVSSSPFCWQIHRPYVVLPEFVLEFADDELQAVISHEAAHLMAGHPLQLFLQRMVELIFWFHPAVWWASWQAAAWREFVGDRAAAGSPDGAAACLRSLLHLAEHGITVTGGMPAGLSFGAGRSLTRQRAARLAQVAEHQCGATGRGLVRVLPVMVVAAAAIHALVLPLNAGASDRSLWSPWPTWSAQALHAVGVPARDFEIDRHRIDEHLH